MNSSIKNVHFAKWLNRKIGSKPMFLKRFDHWHSRDIHRWCRGLNFPKSPALSRLIYDLNLHTEEEYTSLLVASMAELQKDFKEHMYERQKKNRELTRSKKETD